MMKVIPASDFTGYPDGVKTRFRAGAEIEVPSSYAKLLGSKGLIEKPKKTSFTNFADENPDKE